MELNTSTCAWVLIATPKTPEPVGIMDRHTNQHRSSGSKLKGYDLGLLAKMSPHGGKGCLFLELTDGGPISHREADRWISKVHDSE